MQERDRNDEVAELKKKVIELQEQAQARNHLPWLVYSLAGIVALQGLMGLLWSWNLRVVEREWIPNLDARVKALEPAVQTWSRWLVVRQRGFEVLLDQRERKQESAKPDQK